MSEPTKELLAIDRNKLDEECTAQPQLAFRWGQRLAQATTAAKEARNRLKLAEARLATEIRQAPEKFGLVKITEDSVKQTVLLQPNYQQLQQELVQAEYEEDVLQQFCWALSDRKQELASLVQLHGQMYFSSVRPPQASQQSRVRTMRDANEQVRPHK